MSEKPIKIARIFDRYKGPSTYYLYDRMKLLPSERYETICIYLERCSDEPNNQENDFKCHYLSGSKSNPLKWWKLAQVLKEEGVDIIHANRHSATFQGAMGAILAGTPVVISHVHGMNRCRNWRRRLLYKLLSHKITRMIGISQGVVEDIATKFPGMEKKAVLVPNSIDYEKYHCPKSSRTEVRSELSIPPEAFVFTCVARLVPTKGHDLLLRALALVLETYPDLVLLLIGDGPLKDNLSSLSKLLEIQPHVIMAGYRKDISEIMNACDGFVMSSTREGFGLVLAEAMAAGIPVIATGEGGASEVVEGAGVFVAERTVENLAKGMEKIIKLTAQERQAMVDAADQKVRSVYNHKVAVKELQTVYEGCLEEKGINYR